MQRMFKCKHINLKSNFLILTKKQKGFIQEYKKNHLAQKIVNNLSQRNIISSDQLLNDIRSIIEAETQKII
jgi:hypothetical protein